MSNTSTKQFNITSENIEYNPTSLFSNRTAVDTFRAYGDINNDFNQETDIDNKLRISSLEILLKDRDDEIIKLKEEIESLKDKNKSLEEQLDENKCSTDFDKNILELRNLNETIMNNISKLQMCQVDNTNINSPANNLVNEENNMLKLKLLKYKDLEKIKDLNELFVKLNVVDNLNQVNNDFVEVIC